MIEMLAYALIAGATLPCLLVLLSAVYSQYRIHMAIRKESFLGISTDAVVLGGLGRGL